MHTMILVFVLAVFLTETSPWAEDYEIWRAKFEKSGYGWVLIGFEGCPPCERIKEKLLQLSEEEGGRRNLIYYDFDHPDVAKYEFEKHIKDPIVRGGYPLLLRMETKNNETVFRYLQGDTTLEELRNFLELKPKR